MLVLRSALASRRTWWGIATGFLEPVFYLATMGFGLEHMVGMVHTPDGSPISYAAFIAPALLAATTMNGAFYDLSVGFYFKLRHARVYEAVLTTPTGVADVLLGETLWSALRGTLYAIAFLAAMAALGVVTSPWALVMLPMAFAVACSFGLIALAVTTYLRTWNDTQLIQLITVPMLLFATTFYPLEIYPEMLQPIIQALPLYQANVLMRSVAVGTWSSTATFAIGYLIILGLLGAAVALRRLDRILVN
ncbi:ABC transporter permease [Planomonospora sphaerica]|uniref:ABC transporter permease n=1 Tax=Planomonospora sphaerica TaxID=161355 RepID=UPI0018D04737|nr:ABC transporter permease [Planomonospora sphaerica]